MPSDLASTGALPRSARRRGGGELARYLNLRFVEDDTLARKAMATEWSTLGLKSGRSCSIAAIRCRMRRPGPRLLMGMLVAGDAQPSVAGDWAAATAREDPRLIMDLLRLCRETRRREKFGYMLAAIFTLPGLWPDRDRAVIRRDPGARGSGSAYSASLPMGSCWASSPRPLPRSTRTIRWRGAGSRNPLRAALRGLAQAAGKARVLHRPPHSSVFVIGLGIGLAVGLSVGVGLSWLDGRQCRSRSTRRLSSRRAGT